MTLQQIAEVFQNLGITSPPTLYTDLIRDQSHKDMRDHHYD
jgi:hypothetical protein